MGKNGKLLGPWRKGQIWCNIILQWIGGNFCVDNDIISAANAYLTKESTTCVSFVNVLCTVYPKKYAHGFVVLCFVVVMPSFIINSHEVFIHIHQGCFAGTGAIVRFPQCQWSKPDEYGKISQCITTTKHSKAKTVCIFLGIYCMLVLLAPPFILHIWTRLLILELSLERACCAQHNMEIADEALIKHPWNK